MKYDNDTIDQVITIVKYHDFVPFDSKRTVRKLMNLMGEKIFFDLMDLKIADVLAHSEASKYQIPIVKKMIEIGKQIIENRECFSLKDLKIPETQFTLL